MEQILLDTNFVSALFDPRRPNFAAVQTCAQGFGSSDLVYLPVVVLAELRYGIEAAQRAGQDVSHIRQTLVQAGRYPLAAVGRHTAEAYADAPTFHYGTLALLYRASTTALPPGAAVDGTALRRSSISRAANGSLTIMTSGVVMPGTWKCLSEIEASPGGSLGLYVRMIDA